MTSEGFSDNFSAAFLAKLRDVHAHQRRQRAEVLYDIQRAEARLTELRRELTEVDAGIAESEDIIRTECERLLQAEDTKETEGDD